MCACLFIRKKYEWRWQNEDWRRNKNLDCQSSLELGEEEEEAAAQEDVQQYLGNWPSRFNDAALLQSSFSFTLPMMFSLQTTCSKNCIQNTPHFQYVHLILICSLEPNKWFQEFSEKMYLLKLFRGTKKVVISICTITYTGGTIKINKFASKIQ